jgi:hypothetical protein
MGCQCANKEEESKNELLRKEQNLENEEFPEENNNSAHKDGIFGLSNQEMENQAQFRGENNENEAEQEQEQEQQQNNNNDNEKINEEKNTKYSEYPEKMLSLINKIREDPVSYADVIEESIQNIIEDQDKEDETKTRIIYKKKVKVALNRGEPAFREAAEELRNMDSMPPLEMKNDICVPLPEEEDEIKDSSYLREQVKILRATTNIDVFFKDLIKVPEVSALLMIVDDSGKNPGKKRQAVLNKEFKYIGISSKFIGRTFIAYFAFSK